MIKRFAGWTLVLSACLIGSSFAADEVSATAPAAAAPATDAAPAAGATAAAAPVQLNPDHPDTYTVQPGDTLWGISEKFLKNPWDWPEVWHINEKVGNPHLIYPGDVLHLVWNDGKPTLVVADAGTAGIGSKNSVVEVVDANTVKLRPRIREMPVAASIPAIPLKNIESFLNESRVVTLDELNKAPYIVAGPERHIVMGRGDTVYARSRERQWTHAYPEYGIYRAGGPYIDPVTGEVLGYEAKEIGSTRVLATDASIATLKVLTSEEDIRVDDKLLYTDQRKVQSIFYPRQPPEGVKGEIIHIFGSIGFAARNDVVVINKGLREKVDVGHVFAIMQKGEKVRDRVVGDTVTLPTTRAGLLIVFRAFDKVSYGLITRSTRQIGKGDIIEAPRIDIE